MRKSLCLSILFLGVIWVRPSMGQYAVDPAQIGHRVLVVVPMIGKGTYLDPRRPVLLPPPQDLQKAGIDSYSFEVSDDGQHAIVGLVLAEGSPAQRFIGDARVVKAFEKGKANRASIETELRKFKKNFSLVKGPTIQAVSAVPGQTVQP